MAITKHSDPALSWKRLRTGAVSAGSQKSTGTPRTPVSLSSLWQQSA
ncbi:MULTISPECIES: hypothetical protein [unclassified Halomonas]